MGGRGSSRFITILHRGGPPQFITILQRGGLQNLLQYYSFERKMEGYNPFSALNLVKRGYFVISPLRGSGVEVEGYNTFSALNYVKSHHFILVNVDL